MMTLRKIIYLFHMPCFLIISGVFQKRKIYKLGAASGLNFLLCFVLQNTVMYLLMVMLQVGSEYKHSASSYNFTQGLWSFWYLQALFFYNTITGLLPANRKLYWGVLAVYFVLPFVDIVYAFNFTKAASFFVFFLIGFALVTD